MQAAYASHIERVFDLKLAVEDRVDSLRSLAREAVSGGGGGSGGAPKDGGVPRTGQDASMIVAEHRRLLQLLASESDMLVAPGQQLDAALAGVRFPRAQYSAVFDSDHPGNPDSVHSSACSDYTPEPGRPDHDLDDPGPAPSADPEYDLLMQHVELGLRLPGLSSCPDEELELSIVAEFQSLRQQFVHRREKLRLAHAETAQGPHCGWSPADHLWFLKVEKEYTKTKLGAKLKVAG